MRPDELPPDPLQIDVFEPPRQTAPYQPHSRTSRAAAREIQASLNGLQLQVLKLIARAGPVPDERIQEWLGMNPSTERPRRIELVRLGMVAAAGSCTVRSGRTATAWAITDRGWRYIRASE
jgi:hypothetical protein